MPHSKPTGRGESHEVAPRAGARAFGGAVDGGDRDLIRACLAKDQRAWTTLVKKYERLVYAIPRRLGMPNEVVEDTFQEVFAILVRSLPSLQHEAALPQWLATTTRRVAMRLVQRHRKQQLLRPGAEEEDPREASERWEAIAKVSEAIQLLEPSCRDLLMALTRDSETSYAEIAAQLSIPIGSIGPRRARCLTKLLRHLRAAGAGEELPSWLEDGA